MSEFIQDHELLASAMDGIVEPTILRALDGAPNRINITTLNGSNTFNAYSRACHLLREEPDAELTEEYIPQMEELSTMGRYLLNLVNDSFMRDTEQAIELRYTGKKEGADNCLTAEENFRIALERSDLTEDEYGNNKNRIFVDDEGNLVFFKKGYREPTALSFVDLSLNGIAYPAGTLFNIDKTPYGYGKKIAPMTFIHSLEDVTSIAPIRSTLYALPKAEQLPTATHTGLYNTSGTEHTEQNISPTQPLEELKKKLPSQEELAELVGELPEPAEYNTSVWVQEVASAI